MECGFSKRDNADLSEAEKHLLCCVFLSTSLSLSSLFVHFFPVHPAKRLVSGTNAFQYLRAGNRGVLEGLLKMPMPLGSYPLCAAPWAQVHGRSASEEYLTANKRLRLLSGCIGVLSFLLAGGGGGEEALIKSYNKCIHSSHNSALMPGTLHHVSTSTSGSS